ncbi:MAG TPA: MurT ligase domain-containing protein [Acidothermaceae bacterium]|jgi:UDP-N-acetylmuramyl tripeptide synthase
MSRTLRRGDGFVIGGRVVLAACPDALVQLLLGRRVAFVSATNGKTTTTKLLAAAMGAAGPVLTNNSGANMPAGLVAALAMPAQRVADDAPVVLEADETYLPGLLRAAPDALLVLGNLSRDQLDRLSEVAMVARRWRATFSAMPGLTAVANADDPHIVWAASVISDVTWVSVGNAWTADSVLCPSCGAILRRDGRDWSCECGFRRPSPSWILDDGAVVDPGGARRELALRLPGRANEANAVMALVAAHALGVPAEIASPAMAPIGSVGGRYQTVTLGGRRVRLLLGKNPAGWAEMFGMLAPAPAPVVIAINARAADGKDPSWLWDVPFENLAGRLVVATGERRHDLAVRLAYAGVEHLTVEDPWAAMPTAIKPSGQPLDAVGTYTAFREMLRRAGGARDAG